MSSRPSSTARSAARAATPSSRPRAGERGAARVSLSREVIAREALTQIDESGLDALSLRTLAQRLGCEAMSLYHHVAGKGALLDAVIDELIAEVVLPSAGAGTPRTRVRAVCDAYRAVALAHPQAFVLLAARRFNSERALAFLEAVLALFAEAGLPPSRRARAFRMIGFFLNGLGLAEGAIRGGGPMSEQSPLVTSAPGGFGQVQACAKWLGPAGLDAAYEAGIESLLDRVFEEQ